MRETWYEIETPVMGQWASDAAGEPNRFDTEEEAVAGIAELSSRGDECAHERYRVVKRDADATVVHESEPGRVLSDDELDARGIVGVATDAEGYTGSVIYCRGCLYNLLVIEYEDGGYGVRQLDWADSPSSPTDASLLTGADMHHGDECCECGFVSPTYWRADGGHGRWWDSERSRVVDVETGEDYRDPVSPSFVCVGDEGEHRGELIQRWVEADCQPVGLGGRMVTVVDDA